MLFLYYILAKDEERRMTDRFGETYTSYRNRTGMFLPRRIERLVVKDRTSPGEPGFAKVGAVFVMLCVVIVGGGFLLRAYTIRSLPLQQLEGVDVISISPDDTATARLLIHAVLADGAVALRLKSLPADRSHRILAYFIPIDYVMQGMIANTGNEWKLFEQHKTLGMITEYILHPFVHLTGGHAHHMDMATMKHGPEMYDLPTMKRRVIFIKVSSQNDGLESPFDDFDINITRSPLFFVDVHLHTGDILEVKNTPSGSGWGTVPTPMF